MIKLLLTSATILIISIAGITELPPDKCPNDQGYPDGNWCCWAVECPGHKYSEGFGCKTNLLSELCKALKVRMLSTL